MELFEKANKKLHKVDAWLTANKLILNTNKIKVITFKTRNSPPVPSNQAKWQCIRQGNIYWMFRCNNSRASNLKISHGIAFEKN